MNCGVSYIISLDEVVDFLAVGPNASVSLSLPWLSTKSLSVQFKYCRREGLKVKSSV